MDANCDASRVIYSDEGIPYAIARYACIYTDPRSAPQHADASDLDADADQSRVYDPATYIDSGDSLHANGQAGGTAHGGGSGGAGGCHLPE